jgi:tRNA-Thr(GGU) m(6)t(6)A37 methyltransferase TsaA
MQEFHVNPIGQIVMEAGRTLIKIEPDYVPALKALEGFSHINVIWWFDEVDNEELRSVLVTPKPYRKAPDEMGIFATRSPVRPNLIAQSTVQVLDIDHQKGVLQIAYIDANDGTPVLDIKPYTPSLDRVASPSVPDWCSHWPKSLEESGDFDWENEMLF